jgi:hypothetical protein
MVVTKEVLPIKIEPRVPSGTYGAQSLRRHLSNFGSTGAKARHASLTPKQRSRIASKAVTARWNKNKKEK